MVEKIMDQIKSLNYSPENMDPPKAQDPTTTFLANKNAPPLEGGRSTKMVACGLSKMISAHQNSIEC